jgi:hypothetical protein
MSNSEWQKDQAIGEQAIQEWQRKRNAALDLLEVLAALGHCVEVLNNLKPCGHEGDEETGEHYDDCMLCQVEAALAHAEDGACRRVDCMTMEETLLHNFDTCELMDKASTEERALLTEHNEAIRLLKKILHVMENDGGYTPKMCQQLRDECCDDGGEPCRTLDEIRAFFEKERS